MANENLIGALEGQDWLRKAADATQPPLHEALTRLGPLKDVLHGTWLGHPLHPALTDVPVGAWTTALALDALAGSSEESAMGDAADLAIGVGLAGAVAAAVTGATDWSETSGRARNVGLLHGLLNVAAAGLYAASLLERRRGSRSKGVALSVAGYATASFSAWLGGHLVFGEQIGVDHTATADEGQPEDFVAVLNESDLPEGTPVRADAGGVAVLLVRLDGKVHAITNTCTHLGGPLHEGKLEGDEIQCPWHASRFCVTDGALRGGPATFPARQFDVRIREGRIEVRARQAPA